VYDSAVPTTEGATTGRRHGGGGIAFLLAQVGAHAAERFADRIAGLDLTPAQAGLLRAIDTQPGRSQQAVATQLGIPPSRFVFLVDALEQRGLVRRQRNETDRRLYALHLTAQGEELMTKLHAAGAAHEEDICAGLSGGERQALREALRHIAARQGLTPGVHPGYRRLNPRPHVTTEAQDDPGEPTPRTR
jgi:DNA-binding MarR family transcriptional regulator